jgi:hypothetical protein
VPLHEHLNGRKSICPQKEQCSPISMSSVFDIFVLYDGCGVCASYVVKVEISDFYMCVILISGKKKMNSNLRKLIKKKHCKVAKGKT